MKKSQNAAASTTQTTPLTIWTVTSGAAGMRSQTSGLAHAVKSEWKNAAGKPANIIEKTIILKPWAVPLPGHRNPLPFYSLRNNSSPIQQPWPDILLSCGRRSSAISIAIGKASRQETFRVHIQNPQTPTRYFDLVASMQHDNLKGENVIETKLALHKLTSKQLEKEKQIWHPQFNLHAGRPILGVILGGKNKNHGFNQHRLTDLISLIRQAVKENGAQVLITPSGRTEPFVTKALETEFATEASVWLWNKKGQNPYLGILSNADHLLVTADSVSMISESLFTTKPVHIFPLSGTSRRHGIFLDVLTSDNLIHQTGKTIDFSVQGRPSPIDETARIAHMICHKLANRT